MIQASANLHRQLQDLRVQPEYERGLRVLIEHARRNLPAVDEGRLRRAFQVAYWAHRDDRRASGELYIAHPLEVALIAAKDIGFDDTTVVAALLHDTVEDTDLSLDLIEAEFGPDVARITDGVTKIEHVFGTRAMGQAENVRKLMLSMASDIRVILVKFADRLHNMRTLEGLPVEKRLKIAAETQDLFAPLAHRFGLHAIKTELEDLALKHLEPEAYRAIAGGLHAKRRQRERFVEKFITPVRAALEKGEVAFEIYGRPKSIFSIYRKMRRQGVGLDEIYDLFAIRVILQSEGPEGRADCWRVHGLLTEVYQPIPHRFRDFISFPKSNGYQSLHTTVLGPGGQPVEIQIRTAEMHEIAERGVAAHWRYKEVDPAGDGAPAAKAPTREQRLDAMYQWARELLEAPRAEHAGEFVQEFKLDLFDEEIYCFTPKGDLLTLPRGATPVDFAFQVHSEVGFHCIGAKVNGRMVPLSHPLSSGDQVEILTSKKQAPNPDWIKFVVTHKARARIRHHINEGRRKAVEAGRELLEKKLRRARVVLDEQALTRAAAKLRFPSSQQLLFEIGGGLYSADEFVEFIRRPHEPAAAEEAPPAAPAQLQVEGFTHDAREHGRPALVVDGQPHRDLAVQYAPCCNPIPGDEVFGYVSKAGAVRIHRASCRNAPHLLLDHAERIISVEWSRRKDVQFVAALKIVGEDRVGIVSDITTVISKSLKTNIRSITVEGEDGLFTGTLVLFVSDLDQLRRITQRLARLDGIYGVSRLDEGRAAGPAAAQA